MKTKEELTQLKIEYESLTTKLQKLSEDELLEVIGGTAPPLPATELDTNGLFNGSDNLEFTPGLPVTPKLGDSRSMEEKLLPEK